MNKYTWLLDAGHGGLIKGKYVTPGKRSPEWEDGTPQLFEGVFNRAVRASLIHMLVRMPSGGDIGYFILNDGDKDIGLTERVKLANKYHKQHGNCVLLSIHGNAGGGTGFEVFTSPGETASDPIATVFCEEIMKEFPSHKFRPDYSDKDPDKEAPFYLLKKSNCPALLTENLFMDRLEDCKFMASIEGQQRIALAHFNAMKRVEGLPV